MGAEFSATELVDIARQVERCGEAFYRRAAERVRNRAVRELFDRLRDEETAHAREFEALLARLELGIAEWRQDDEYLATMRSIAERRVFPSPEAVDEAVGRLKDEREAVALAIRFETDTVAFLRGLGRMVRAEDRAMLDSLVAEEEGHVRRLEATAAALRAGS